MKTTTLEKLKCYVNVDRFANAERNTWRQATPDHGSRIRIQYRIKEIIKVTRKAQWTIEPDDANIEGPDASLVRDTTDARMITLRDGQEVRGVSNRLVLPDIGGNKYTVTCRKKRTLVKDTQIIREFETWRRLWFSVYYTHDEQRGLIAGLQNAMQRAYRGVYIDLQRSGRPTHLRNKPGVVILRNRHQPTGAGVPPWSNYMKRFFGGSWPELAMSPFHMAFTLVKQTASFDKITFTAEFDINHWRKIDDDRYIANDGSAAMEKVGGYWTIYFKLFGPYLRCLTTGMRGQLQQGLGRTRRMGTNDLVQSFTAGGTEITRTGFSTLRPTVFKVDLSAPPLRTWSQRIENGPSFVLSVEMMVLDLSLLGFAYGNLQFVETHEHPVVDAAIDACIASGADRQSWADKDAAVTQMATVHEAAHVLGMVSPGHARRYVLDGDHCGHNTQKIHPTYPPVNAGVELCVMYHQLHDQMRPLFCARCRAALGKVPMRDADLRPSPYWTNTSKDV